MASSLVKAMGFASGARQAVLTFVVAQPPARIATAYHAPLMDVFPIVVNLR